ncbi:MAG: hypothetical protein LBL65_01960 [Campylobacteraceae bacterium]|jgi:hypothetical protein|nr:hypothetical protein [Campylobacteraceae bacterium]
MAGCNCGADGKSTAEKIAALVVCTKTHQCYITYIVEKALPILFWLGIIGSFTAAFKAAGAVSHFNGIFSTILAFLVVLIVGIVSTFLTFYVLYLLKAIKDNVKSHKDECGCECSDTAEPEKKDDAAPKKRGRKPSAKTTV